MNIVLAQLKKDIQCQRTPLILWGICLGIGLIAILSLHVFAHNMSMHVRAPDMSDAEVMIGILSLGGLAFACALAVGFGMFLLVPILVIRIVHEDVLMGTTAFWLTRPIPRKDLLAAKALLIAVLPLPLILFGGANVRFGAGGAGHFWTAESAWIAALAALASITLGIQDYLAYGLALLFGKVVFAGILKNLWSYFHGARMLYSNAPDLFHLCYFAGFTLVFIHQYLTLQTRRSLAMIIAIIAVVSVLQMLIYAPANIPPGP